MADLKTNYVDDKLDASKNQLRKYQMIQNDDGTVSLVDVTEYLTQGTNFGAKDINDTNTAINELNNSLTSHTHDSRYYTKTEMNTKLNAKSNLLMVADITSTATYNISGGETGNISINVAKAGYTPLGVVGHTTQSSHVFAGRINFTDANTVSLFLKNTASGTISHNVNLRVLYVKNS